jgi:hypothetical protein
MNSFSDIARSLLSLIISLALLAISFFALFRTRQLIAFYLKSYQKWYLNSLKKSFFSNKYYQALTKYQYESAKKSSKKKWTYFNFKLSGILALLMA